ncbi:MULTISPECIES: DUF4209 domain-containing protein [Bacillus cereus group]|nr:MULTISPECIES: DUF4209 domain-containing protein [Bacillus cereus group]EJQ00603.1 hypothetical protein IAU_00145 [Bacillus cereus IS075]EOO86806.1 hypothetical protein IGS_04116 [Bacillus cereus IS845/00]EOO95520.1 hypothetical protein IGQ_03873 [Bacillus cereus IS195]KKZ95612.1 hypothetical protein B4153_2391 [Bacillus cereus]KMP80954.1 hypothetical protein TU63_26345 [Bacillus cereus]
MSFNDYENNFSKVIKTKQISAVFVSDLGEMIPKENEEIDFICESIVQRTLVGAAFELYNSEEINNSIPYSVEKAEMAKEPFMKFRYYWHLLNYEKKKMVLMQRILELIEEDELLREMFYDDPCLKMNIIKYFLKYGKKIKPIRQNIWDLVVGLIMKDKSDLILIMSDVVPFIESEGDSEIKNRYYEYIALVVNELEVQLKKEGNGNFLDRLYEEVTTVSIQTVDRNEFKERRANLALSIAEANKDQMAKMHYAHKASVIFSDINNQEGARKALAVLSESINKFGTAPQQRIPLKLGKKIINDFEENYKKVFGIFSDHNVSLENRVSDLAFLVIRDSEINGQKVKVLFYRPFPELKTIESSEKNLSSSIASQILPSVHLGSNKVIGIDKRDIEAKSLCYSTHFQFTTIPAMLGLKKDKDFNLEFLLNYVQRSEIVSDNDIVFIEEALEHFYNNKFISFLSVLVPTIECLLRRVYELYNGTDIATQRKDSNLQTTVNLSDILKDDKVKENLSEDFIGYLQYLLNDDTSSENIRNNIAHRLTDAEFYNEGRSLIVLHLLLVLTSYFSRKG